MQRAGGGVMYIHCCSSFFLLSPLRKFKSTLVNEAVSIYLVSERDGWVGSDWVVFPGEALLHHGGPQIVIIRKKSPLAVDFYGELQCVFII